MEQAWENYHNQLRARMSNLIDRYAQPPQITAPTANLFYANPAPPPIIQQPFVPPIQTQIGEIQRVASPALDRVVKNLPEIVIEPISMKISSKAEVMDPSGLELIENSSSSLCITMCCWILGFLILGMLAVAIYFAITMSKVSSTEEEEDEL